MSVLIKGMKMPDNCESCAFESGFGFCLAKSDNFCGYTNVYKRPDWCPLIEVPVPHGDLIDKDALNLDYEVEMAEDWKTAHEIANCVKYAPTVIESEGEE